MSEVSTPASIKQVLSATGIAAILIIISAVHLSRTPPAPPTEFDHWKLRPSIEDPLALADIEDHEAQRAPATQIEE